MKAELLVNDYDLILVEVKERYPNISIDTQHQIALQLDRKLDKSRERYIESYKESEQKEVMADNSDRLANLDENFESFMKTSRSYQTWTTRYPRVGNKI